MRNIDQAPTPNESNEPINQTNTSLERVRTSTGDTPAYPGYQPNRSEMNPSEYSKTRRAVALGLGAVMSVGAFLGMVDKAATTGMRSIAAEEYTGNGTNYEASGDVYAADGPEQYTNPEVDSSNIDIATYPHESFKDLAFATQIRLCSEYLSQERENGAHDRWLADNEALNGYKMSGGIAESIYANPQDIENRLILDQYIAQQDTNYNRAKNLVGCIYKDGTVSHDAVIENIGSGGVMTPGIVDVFYSSEVFTQGSFGDITASGTPTRVMTVADPNVGKAFNAVVQEFTSEDNPDQKQIVLVETYAYGHKYFQEQFDGWSSTGN